MSEHFRLLSLAPTQTEILAGLGMIDSIMGITEDCDYPEAVKGIRRFGSWYSPNIPAIREAKPDLVFTFGSHHEEIRETLQDSGLKVYHSEPPTIAESLDSMGEIAALLGRETIWADLLEALQERLARIRKRLRSRSGHRPSVFRIMNWDPLITPGPGAFQHDVIEFSGGVNVAGDGPAPYFVCDVNEMLTRDPEIIFFCEPKIKTFLENDASWKEVSAVRCGRVYIYDCGLTCRSGPRIVDMAERLNEAILAFEGA